MTAAVAPDGGSPALRRRGPGRPRDPVDTKGAIVAAARAEFARHGYDKTTIRGIARSAGVDPALVYHYFGSKQNVLVAVLDLPVNPAEVVSGLLEAGLDQIGERLVRLLLSIWDDPDGRTRFLAVIRTAMTNDAVADVMREFFAREVLAKIIKEIGAPDPELRASLAFSHVMGMAMARYVLRLEPLASASPDEIARLLGPTLERYLLPGPPA
ncbi:MAG TPA: TetR family transcriptional regulator [Actinomycetes bacterium]|nr:TetR family transcriptional regulator [Actinomycetes bacterium]